ncbi:hypothetical protein MY10362_006261 [Beauveria mimosiformis]
MVQSPSVKVYHQSHTYTITALGPLSGGAVAQRSSSPQNETDGIPKRLSSASSSNLERAKQIVARAAEESAARNKARIAKPSRNKYRLDPRTKDFGGGATSHLASTDDAPPLFDITEEIRDAAALVAEADALERHGNGTDVASGHVARADKGEWWMGQLDHGGEWPWGNNPSDFRVFRNVKDYGAVGDGKTALDRPKIMAAPQFIGLGVISTNYYVPNGGTGSDGNAKQWLTFYQQIRNFKIDISRTSEDAHIAGIHYQVAQGTSLQFVDFIASKSSSTTQQAIFAENGNGGFMSDLTFEGGQYGSSVECTRTLVGDERDGLPKPTFFEKKDKAPIPGLYTITVPKDVRVVGEVWSQIAAFGRNFGDVKPRRPLFKVGQPDEMGSVQMQDLQECVDKLNCHQITLFDDRQVSGGTCKAVSNDTWINPDIRPGEYNTLRVLEEEDQLVYLTIVNGCPDEFEFRGGNDWQMDPRYKKEFFTVTACESVQFLTRMETLTAADKRSDTAGEVYYRIGRTDKKWALKPKMGKAQKHDSKQNCV